MVSVDIKDLTFLKKFSTLTNTINFKKVTYNQFSFFQTLLRFLNLSLRFSDIFAENLVPEKYQ